MNNFKSKLVCISEEVQFSLSQKECKYLLLESNYLEGYYTNLPCEKNTPTENHLFLISRTGVSCFQDKIMRIVSNYERSSAKALHVYPGTVKVGLKSYNLIRFRKSECEDVKHIVQLLVKHDIHFLKRGKFTGQPLIVQFKKQVQFKELLPGVYQDASANHEYFLPLDFDLDFPIFNKMVAYIRNNCDFKHFECSLVYVVNHDYAMHDFAKIYSPNCEPERLTEFSGFFNKAAKEFGLM